MKAKKLVSLSMAAVLGVGGVSVLGIKEVKADDKVSVVVATNWGEGDSKYDYFYPVFEKFQEENADTLDISLQTYSTEDYKTKIKTQTASGDLPDVFTYWGGGMMKDMVDAGLLLNVDDYFADSENVAREDFEEGAFDYYIAGDGNAYGIPIESTRGVLLANREIFEQYGLEYPTTYEELLEIGKVLNEMVLFRWQLEVTGEHLQNSFSVSFITSSRVVPMKLQHLHQVGTLIQRMQ